MGHAPPAPRGEAQGSARMEENPKIGVMLVQEGKLPPLPLREIEVRANITGIIADVEVFQVFENPYDVAVECTYLFPLPHDAAVYDLEMRVGKRVIRGEVYERQAARVRYEQAKAAGDGAALLEQERPNLFTTSVANLLPESRIEVRIRFAGAVQCAQGRATFTMPLTLTPRFCPPPPEGGGGPAAARINPTALIGKNATGGPKATIEVRVKTGIPLKNFRSVLHEVIAERKGEDEVHFRTGEVLPDRDFILQYDFGGEKIESALFTYAPKSPSPENPGTFLLFLVPPLLPKLEEIFAREFLFVLDRSGSMGGMPMEAARRALQYCLRGMRPGDTFNIVAFDDRVDPFSFTPVAASQENILRADAFLETIDARGGTVLNPALLAALSTRPDPKRQRSVVLLTDGGVGNEDEIFRTVESRLGDGRLYVFSIGAAPNHHLVEKLASLGRGFARHIPNAQSIEGEVVAFLTEAEKPLLVRPCFRWPDFVRDVTPEPIPDLSSDRPLIILGHYTQARPFTLEVSGKRSDCLDGKKCLFSRDFVFPEEDTAHPVLPQMWARSRVELLLDRERALGGRIPALKKEIIELACAHRLMSPYTSFVAVEERSEEERKKAKGAVSVDIPNYAPAGTDMAAPSPSASASDVALLSGGSPVKMESAFVADDGSQMFNEEPMPSVGAMAAPAAPMQVLPAAPVRMAAPPMQSSISSLPYYAPPKARSSKLFVFLLLLLLAGGVLTGGPLMDLWTWWKPLAWAGLIVGSGAMLFGLVLISYVVASKGGWRAFFQSAGQVIREEPVPNAIAVLVVLFLWTLLPLSGAALDFFPLKEGLFYFVVGLPLLVILGAGVANLVRRLWLRARISRQRRALKDTRGLTAEEFTARPARGDLALKWLALHQRFDGSWGEDGAEWLETLATGTLALLAHGNGPEGNGPYRPHRDRSAERLIAAVLAGKLEGEAKALAVWAACEVMRGHRFQEAQKPLVALLGGLTGDFAECARAAAFHAGIFEQAPARLPDLRVLFPYPQQDACQIGRGYHEGLTRSEEEPARSPELCTARLALAAAFASGKQHLLAQRPLQKAAA